MMQEKEIMKMLEKSYAKVNVFLKIVGFKEGYHLINSRFVIIEELHDMMWFEKSAGLGFEVVGDFDCTLEQNTIYKAYKALIRHFPQKEIADFVKSHKVVVYKNIPAFAGLGGGSSNAATFLHMINRALDLKLSIKELSKVAMDVGADVPFFVSGCKSANVTGFGEIIKEFKEEPVKIKTFTPQDIQCSTAEVYRTYRKNYSENMKKSEEFAKKIENMKSVDILQKYSKGIGATIYNASNISTITAFEMISLEDALKI